MWWDSLELYGQILFITANSASVILLIMLIMGFIGTDAEFDVGDALVEVAGLKLLNIRCILAFLSVGGWLAFIINLQVPSHDWWISLIVGIIGGLSAAVLIASIIKGVEKLEVDGTSNYNDAIGRTATVYIRVPKNAIGFGKVNVLINSSLQELDAITHDKHDLLTGNVVYVTGIDKNNRLICSSKKEEVKEER